jgi:RimJ/RimL family protein N-acetyltransferase
MGPMQDTGTGGTPDSDQYFLQTERLGFRPWTAADLGLAMGLWGDVNVTKLIGGPFSREQVQARLSLEISNLKTYGVQYWPVFLLSNGEHLGCCGLRPYQLDQGVYEVGVHIRSGYWGNGYAPEAVRAVMEFAFDTLGAKGLFAGHNPANEASRHLVQKLGFHYTHDEYYSPTGLHHPSYMLSADEFAPNRAGSKGGRP